jgi:tetratricopeptide (TPR) repeat protein/GT2 family glycosyltransferase
MLNRLRKYISNSQMARQDNAKENKRESDSLAEPSSKETYIERGDRLQEGGKLTEAIDAYRQAIKIAPKSPQAYQKLAQALKQKGRLADAAFYYRLAINLNSLEGENAEETSQQTSSIQRSDKEQFVDLSQFSLTVKPNLSKNKSNEQTTTQQEIEPQKIELSEDSRSQLEAAEVYLQQAQTYRDRGNWTEAIAAGNRAIQIAPSLAKAHKLLGNIMQQMGNYAEALGYYAKAIELQPDLAEVYANLGTIYAQKQDSQKAINYYQKAIALQPDFAGVYRNLGKLWTKLGESEKARECQLQALKLEPDRATAQEHFNLGVELQQQGQFEEAANCYRQAIELNPKFAKSYLNLAEVLEKLGKWQEAGVYYRQVLNLNNTPSGRENPALDSNFVPVKHDKSLSAQPTMLLLPNSDNEGSLVSTNTITPSQQSNVEAAIDYYTKEAISQPESAEIQANLGSLYAQQQQWQKAIACYKKALALQPNLPEVYRNLASVFTQVGKEEEAADCWYETLRLKPNWATEAQYLELAKLLSDRGKFDRAISCYRQAISLKPDLLEAYHLLGDILIQQGKEEEEILLYQQALARNIADWQVYYRLGEVYLTQKKWGEAVERYQKATELKADFWRIWHRLGDALSNLQQWEEAIVAYSQAIKLNNNFSSSYNNLGVILLKLRRWQEAANSFRQAIELKPDFAWSYYNLGEALVALGQWDAAISAYRSALNLKPDLPEVEQKLNIALRARDNSKDALAMAHNSSVDPHSYHKALGIKPNDPGLYVRLANTMTHQSRLNKAIGLYKMALRLQPDYTEAKIQLKLVTERKKRLYKAFQQVQAKPNAYALWLKENLPEPAELDWMPEIVDSLGYKPSIGLILTLDNTPEDLLQATIQSVLDQIYPYWELCIAGDAASEPYIKSLLQNYTDRDNRIKVIFRESNTYLAAAANRALELTTGEFVALIDGQDLLTHDALYEVALLLNKHPEADLIYSDEDKLDDRGYLLDPIFKPDWCPDSLLSRNYIGHLAVYRRNLINRIGGLRSGYEGNTYYDLVLRFTERTNNIFHIPKVLYHRRDERCDIDREEGAKILAEALKRRSLKGKAIPHSKVPGVYTVRYEISEYKLVSIIIPTRNLGDILDRCLQSIFSKSTYPNYEVILIDNGSDEVETLAIFETWEQREPERFKCYRFDMPFNYSQLTNYGVSKAKGDYILLLNNDTEIITSDWIEAMVEQAQRPTIGVVGAILLYPDDTIQHAGVVVGLGGAAGHSHKYYPLDHVGYANQLACVNNYSAVTAACLMCRREVFDRVNGFDETLKVAFNDVDFCLKIKREGYHNICLPHVLLYHHESKSRGFDDTPVKRERYMQEVTDIQQKWRGIIVQDPCYSPNLTKIREDYSIGVKSEIEILEVVLAENEAKLSGFRLDGPQAGQFLEGLTIDGWVIGAQSPASMVEIIYNKEIIQKTEIDLPRPDVAKAYSHIANIEKTGFRALVDINRLPPEIELSVRVVLADGDSALLGKVRLRH